MDRASVLLEEHLREAAAVGDIQAVQELITLGVDINSRHSINGWAAFHWACKRHFADIVLLLLQNGADKNILSNSGEAPASVCTNSRILQMLGVQTDCQVFKSTDESMKFMPNYLKNPTLNLNSELRRYKTEMPNSTSSNSSNHVEKDLILKIRVANTSDPDFIEIEIPRNTLTYDTLVKKSREELSISDTDIIKIRKLPNTKLRNDKDIQRLTDFQEIEVVISEANASKQHANGTAVSVTPTNNYQSISKKDQTILY